MTGEDAAFEAAIDDLRTLMEAAVASDWQELHIREGDTEIFIAAEGGGGNPMLEEAGDANDFTSVPASVREVAAPHVCTIVSVRAALGESVAEGQGIAVVSVLDEPLTINAPCAGQVVAIGVSPGDLAEFGTVLIRIAEAGS